MTRAGQHQSATHAPPCQGNTTMPQLNQQRGSKLLHINHHARGERKGHQQDSITVRHIHPQDSGIQQTWPPAGSGPLQTAQQQSRTCSSTHKMERRALPHTHTHLHHRPALQPPLLFLEPGSILAAPCRAALGRATPGGDLSRAACTARPCFRRGSTVALELPATVLLIAVPARHLALLLLLLERLFAGQHGVYSPLRVPRQLFPLSLLLRRDGARLRRRHTACRAEVGAGEL